MFPDTNGLRRLRQSSALSFICKRKCRRLGRIAQYKTFGNNIERNENNVCHLKGLKVNKRLFQVIVKWEN